MVPAKAALYQGGVRVSPSPCTTHQRPPRQSLTPPHSHWDGSRRRCGMMATFLSWWSTCVISALVLWPGNGQSAPADLGLESINQGLAISTCPRRPPLAVTQMHICRWHLTRYVMSFCMGSLKKKLTFMDSPIFTSAVCIPAKQDPTVRVRQQWQVDTMDVWHSPDFLLTYVDEVFAFVYLWVRRHRSCCLSFT